MDRLTTKKWGELLIKYNDGEYRSPCFGCESINKCNLEKATCGFYKALEKLAEYEDLEEQEKLLKLPCAVGDTVYTNCSMQGWHFREENRPYEARVVFVGFNGSDNYINVEFDNARMHCMLQFRFSDIGKNIFLTRKEAEAASKEL